MSILFRAIAAMLLLSISSTFGYSQKCLTSERRTKLLQEKPQLAEKWQQQEAETQRWIATHQANLNLRNVEIIPVVVHVLWRTPNENISEEQILSQLDVLNNDFRKLNADFNTGPTAFRSLGADVEIEFCLASVDPLGNPTTGITRTKTNIEGIGMTDNWYQTSDGGKTAWDINKYLNIWVCDMGDDETLGFATPPGFADPPESDGAVIGHQYFGTTGTAAGSFPNHLGRTTTHEIGHYFNLEHLWGPEEGGCEEDDFVNDTPLQDYDSEGCPDFPSHDFCTPSGNGIMFNNFMDYTDDECMTMFTQGQKMRMLAALNGPRAALLSGNACSVATSVHEAITLPVSLFPNPANDRLIIGLDTKEIEIDQMIIFNSVGKKMLLFQAGNHIEVDISDLPKGIYFLTSADSRFMPQKFIITK